MVQPTSHAYYYYYFIKKIIGSNMLFFMFIVNAINITIQWMKS